MKHRLGVNSPTTVTRAPRRSGLSLLLGLAGCSLLGACSGYYPLGEASRGDQPIDSFPASRGPLVRPAHAPGAVPAPDFTIDLDEVTDASTHAAVGDLDGDGRGDMAVGIGYPDTDVVALHVRYGGPRPAGATGVLEFARSGAVLTLDHIDNFLSVAGVGDVDGDGYDDLLARTAECNISVEGSGAYLVYGGPERLQGVQPLTDLAAHFVSPLSAPSSRADGSSCDRSSPPSAAGDLDGDGLDDLVLTSEPLMLNDGSQVLGTGEGAYVFYGRTQRFTGEVPFASADAVFHHDRRIAVLSLGDANADGMSDLVLAPYYAPIPGSYFLSGREQRWSGTLELDSSGTLLAGVAPTALDRITKAGDLDGDGLGDLILQKDDLATYLFYGGPGLFEDGFDLAQADVTLHASGSAGLVYAVGDRDGDGDDELLDQFDVPNGPVPLFTRELAVAAGSRERLAGSFSFPEAEVLEESHGVRFPETPGRCLYAAIPAGDLDGDGAADLFTTSWLVVPTAPGSFELFSPQLHVHYGQLAAPAAPPLR